MFKPLTTLLDRVVKTGALTIVTANGVSHRFGNGDGPPVTVELGDRRLEWGLALDPNLAAGEAYMNGRLRMREGTIYDLIEVILRNAEQAPMPGWAVSLDRARYMTRRIAQYNPARRSRRNVAHHYDIDSTIYDLFLDERRQYSCAYFQPSIGDLGRAQAAKLDHIAAKLKLASGMHVLDIGCGWGGLATHLATCEGARVSGITLSVEQLKGAEARSRAENVEGLVDFRLADYRSLEGTYDRIVSVGMFEHVGVNHYGMFYRKVAELLRPDGVALIHFIGRSDRPAATNPFIAKYIFPGGYIPALSEVLPAIERSGLVLTDVEVLRYHYAETLRLWRERFRARWDEACRVRDERFCRMWEFYLAGSEAAFRYQGLVVFQLQLARRIDSLPITRDYMQAGEARYAAARQASPVDTWSKLAGE
jgi:cyclopropane-fatty-acyl-phospholipid synthase